MVLLILKKYKLNRFRKIEKIIMLKIGIFFTIFIQRIIIHSQILQEHLMKAIYGSPFLDDEENEEKKAKAPDPFSDRFLKTRQIILTGEVNKELADEIGISAGTISRYLNYQRMPTIENLLKLKYAFNCGWDDLLDFDEPIDD